MLVIEIFANLIGMKYHLLHTRIQRQNANVSAPGVCGEESSWTSAALGARGWANEPMRVKTEERSNSKSGWGSSAGQVVKLNMDHEKKLHCHRVSTPTVPKQYPYSSVLPSTYALFPSSPSVTT